MLARRAFNSQGCRISALRLFGGKRNSYSSFAGASAETVRIPCQSNGSIEVDIYHPVAAPPAGEGPHSVLLYLPRGPLLSNPEHEASTISLLRGSLSCHIVQVNYRLDRQHQYPTPIHDVLAGYDWAVEHLLPQQRSLRATRIAVCGELVGGGLAAALALTECRIGRTGISGAAVNNAVVDWVSIGLKRSVMKGKRVRDRKQVEDPFAKELTDIRGQLFTKPEHYFDPFASPILFFRGSGEDVPPAPPSPPTDDMEVLSMLEREEFYRQQLSLNLASAENSSDSDLEIEEARPKKRKASLRFPSQSSGLRLPPFLISAGIDSSLSEQAAELTHVLRQSYARQSTHRAPLEFGRKVLTEEEEALDDNQADLIRLRNAEIEKKGRLQLSQGLGLWDITSSGRSRVLEAAQWLKQRLN